VSGSGRLLAVDDERLPELLVAYDDSPAARAALTWAIDDAQGRDLGIVLLYVVSSLSELEFAAIQVNTDPIRRRFQDLLTTTWSEPLRVAGVRHRTRLAVGRPADCILAAARNEDVAAIVMGMSARGLLHEIVLGTVARHVLHEARRPVIAVPAGWPEAESSSTSESDAWFLG
jgi:nucleotide-binding universal stress UspA family protein